MKVLAFLLAMLCFAAAEAHTFKTNLLGKRLSLVPEMGVTFSNFSQGNATTDLGFIGGLRVRIGKKKHLQTGIYYSTIRYAANLDNNQLTKNQVTSSYFSIPTLVGITPVHISMVDLRLQAGMVFQFKGTGEVENFANAQFNPTIWNARLAVNLSVWRIEANASFDFALTNTYSNVNSGKNRCINVSLGFRF